MSTRFSSLAQQRDPALLSIIVGGTLAGLFDLIAALALYGWGVPRVIAGGVLGREAFEAGAGVWALGVFLHFFITVCAAAVYYFGSLRWTFLKTHPLVCGMFFGIAVFLVMNLIVLPLSALQSVGPYTLRELLQGLLIHMFLVGLPIALTVHRFGRAR